MEWSHTVLGKFDISQQWLGLDLRNLFLDPLRAETTLFHETTHSLISRTTDTGQAMQNITFFMDRFAHLTKGQQTEMLIELKESQVFVQEGFATFMEMQRLRQRASWDAVLTAKEQMHPDYLARFEKMYFMFGKTHKARERFTKKISLLVMESGFRKNAPSLDLLRSPEALRAYLKEEDNNPGKRLEKVLAALRTDEHILVEKPRKIAKRCGIKFFEPATKDEVATFVNYLLGLAGLPQDYTIEMVGKTNGGNVLVDTMDNLLVTNMNLDLAKTGMMVWEADAIDFEASHAQVAFMVEHSAIVEDENIIEQHLQRKFEVNVILFGKNGEKYMCVTSVDHAQQLLKDQLKDATVLTKWGITNIADSSFSISTERKPDVIIYNRPSDMLVSMRANEGKLKDFKFIHLGMSQDHPFQSLLIKINGQNTIHYVNGFGNAGISKVIEFMKKRGKRIDAKDLLPDSQAINDTLATMGMPWDVDWVATMVDQKTLVRR